MSYTFKMKPEIGRSELREINCPFSSRMTPG